ncbi:MAG TPA: hypothetical protein VNA89_10390 [Gemmatimonadaceae bacterium]|nr:hypothetical protein [Gemmatimonadaceae bacterium]
MAVFEYDILVGKDEPAAAGGVQWYLASDMRESVGDHLPAILNALGRAGWEVVALGDVGFDARTEIVLKRKG